MKPIGMLIVIPSRLGVGEEFSIKVKVRGEVRPFPCAGNWNDKKPGLRGPFNLNIQRQIKYVDDAIPEWSGRLEIEAEDLDGAKSLEFDGENQGAYEKDRRAIKSFRGFRFKRPGFHFITVIDSESGLSVTSNPVFVSEQPLAARIFWGDPHWQTFFSDGIRCPEELYAFARFEAFLDFGAISDHMEGVTDRQWDYFQAVTNDWNDPGAFASLIGQEWTNHDPAHGAPGHRNIYYRGNGGPVLRSTSPDCDTLQKLWQRLDEMGNITSMAIPHHSANTVMGVDWSQGWNPKYEKAVEIHSVWGNSERHADDGNPMPIAAQNLKGEMKGRHVIDALKLGYRFGFVGGGDIHDGRPGDAMHNESYPKRDYTSPPQGFTAVYVPELTREAVFDAIWEHRSYATTKTRLYLEAPMQIDDNARRINIRAASEDGISKVTLVRNGCDTDSLEPDCDQRIVEGDFTISDMAPDDFAYLRVTTMKGNMAWSSPFWGDDSISS